MKSEIQNRAEFSSVRYGQCWEDALLLIDALEPRGKRCVSIGSAGDNSFSLLAAGAEHVTAVEMNPAQVACMELRRAAYLLLEYGEFLELLGVRPSARRGALFAKVKSELGERSRGFWETDPRWLTTGPIASGRFENYFRLFRERVLPLAHSRRTVMALLEPRDRAGRERFYEERWNNRRWRWIFQLFFSRFAMGRLGRDPEFFKYVEGSVADRILDRTRHALVELEPSRNPYLWWILTGTFGDALPHALEPEAFDAIRRALEEDRFTIDEGSLEGWLEEPEERADAFNLSDIFEYMSESGTRELLEKIVDRSSPAARLAYWNMLAPRSRPKGLADRLRPLDELSRELFLRDRAFFYSRFVVEEVSS